MKPYAKIYAIILLLSIYACDRNTYRSFTGYAQGGTYSVKYNARGVKTTPERLQAGVDSILHLIDTTLSGYNKGSQLSRFNAGEAICPNEIFLDMIAISDRYRELTGGAFDVNAAALYNIWGFGFSEGHDPSPAQIDSAMEVFHSRREYNFNAIAQGYSCDLVADWLRSQGIKDMLVDIGEIFCQGLNPSGKGWKVGIDTPFDGNDTPGASISGIWISDGGPHGIVTSGNYRKFYIRDGRKYAHTIDPRTGWPVQHNLLSATVIAPTATEADALATSFMVMGFEESKAWLAEHPQIKACLITDSETWTSADF